MGSGQGLSHVGSGKASQGRGRPGRPRAGLSRRGRACTPAASPGQTASAVAGLTHHSWTPCVFRSLQNPHFLTSFCRRFDERVTVCGLNCSLISTTWRYLALLPSFVCRLCPQGVLQAHRRVRVSGLCRPSGTQGLCV